MSCMIASYSAGLEPGEGGEGEGFTSVELWLLGPLSKIPSFNTSYITSMFPSMPKIALLEWFQIFNSLIKVIPCYTRNMQAMYKSVTLKKLITFTPWIWFRNKNFIKVCFSRISPLIQSQCVSVLHLAVVDLTCKKET